MSAIAITRARHDKDHPFIVISSAIARALPVETLGLLVKLLSFGSGWEIDRERLQRDFAVRPGEIKRLLPDLVKRGHLAYERPRDQQTSQFSGSSTWHVIELPTAAAQPQVHMEEIDHVEIDVVDNDPADCDALESHTPEAAASHGTRAEESSILDSTIPSKSSSDIEKQSLRAGARVDACETPPPSPIHPYLAGFLEPLGHPGQHAPLLEAEVARLGDAETRAVLLGCGNAGSWQYILTALKRRKTPSLPPPNSAPPPSGQSLTLRPLALPPLGAAWVTACQFIPQAAARLALSYSATITEPDVQAVRVEAAAFDGDLLAADGVQAALAMMRDMDIRVDIVQQPPDVLAGWAVTFDDPVTQAGAA